MGKKNNVDNTELINKVKGLEENVQSLQSDERVQMNINLQELFDSINECLLLIKDIINEESI
jgi:hypothetical protein